MRRAPPPNKPFVLSASVLVVAAALIVTGTCNAEERPRKAVATAAGAPVAQIACAAARQPEMQEAVGKARAVLDGLGLKTKAGYFAAYTMPGMKRNPFDLKPLAPDSGPRDGVAQARPPHCTIEAAGDGRLIVRFVTPLYRFFEQGAGWSAPLRDGLFKEVEVSSSGGVQAAHDTWTAKAS